MRSPETISRSGKKAASTSRHYTNTTFRLGPHEDQWTDVILLGHSMGGLLAADIALVFRHRIIGVINFDVPFLGMHPGIVKAGLGSIFNPPPTPADAPIPEASPGKKPSRIGTLFNPRPNDPNYNPSFDNDVVLPVRKGWENTLHWVNKHYQKGLREATKGLVKSHFEFGSAMADYRELKDRYARVRALEEDDERKRKGANPQFPAPPRIRFVNYYTVSTGRPKKPKSPKSPSPSRPSSRQGESIDERAGSIVSISRPSLAPVHNESSMQSPRLSIDVQEHRGDEIIPVSPQEPLSATTPVDSVRSPTISRQGTGPPDLPDIPPIPREPLFVDLMQFQDKTQRKAAEKEHDQALKEYQKAVKARNKAINERTKLEEKWEKQQKKDAEELLNEQHTSIYHEKSNKPSSSDMQILKDDLEAVKLQDHDQQQASTHPYGNYDFSRSAILSQPAPDDQASITDSNYTLATTDSNQTHASTSGPGDDPSAQKKKKLKKFCMLPPKDAQGNKDPTWVKVFMENMDEVTAHTSLFFISAGYERLVGDVGARIEDWVREADSMRLIREMGDN